MVKLQLPEKKKSTAIGKVKFTLRILMFGILVLCGILAHWTNKKRRHDSAQEKLIVSRFEFHCGFEDPIGPNFLFTWSNFIPPNGYFPITFAEHFCIRGSFECMISDCDPTRHELELLKHLVHLRKVTFQNARLPSGWSTPLQNCKSLNCVDFVGIRFRESDFKELSHLDVDGVGIFATDLSHDSDSFVRSCQKLRHLRALKLGNTGLGQADINQIRDILLSCEISSWN